MARVALSVPEIWVNDVKIVIVSNSFSYDKGEAAINVRSASKGGGETETVHTVDGEAGFTELSFSLFPENASEELIREWKENIAINVIKATQFIPGGTDIILTFPGLSLTNKPTREASADGTVEFEFKGDQGI